MSGKLCMKCRFNDVISWVILQDMVLCKVYRKATSLKVLEQWASMEEETSINKSTTQLQGCPSYTYPASPISSNGTNSNCGPHECMHQPMITCHVAFDTDMGMGSSPTHLAEELLEDNPSCSITSTKSSSLRLPLGQEVLPKLQVPKADLVQDPLLAQICSPWFENILRQFTPPSLTPFANMLQFP